MLPIICLTYHGLDQEEYDKFEETCRLLKERGLTKVLSYHNAGQEEALMCINQMLQLAQKGDHSNVVLTQQQQQELQRLSACLDKEKV